MVVGRFDSASFSKATVFALHRGSATTPAAIAAIVEYGLPRVRLALHAQDFTRR